MRNEKLFQLAIHLQESVKGIQIFFHIFLREILLVRLNAEMLVNLLFLCVQESLDLLNSCIFHESCTVFKSLVLVCVGIVTHQELG